MDSVLRHVLDRLTEIQSALSNELNTRLDSGVINYTQDNELRLSIINIGIAKGNLWQVIQEDENASNHPSE